jgi:hypothetical protein
MRQDPTLAAKDEERLHAKRDLPGISLCRAIFLRETA